MPNNKEKKRKKTKAADTRQRSAAEINEALLCASSYANVMSTKAAIDAGADVNYSRDRYSCLMVASLNSHVEMVALLLNAGADEEAKGATGATALSVAIAAGEVECVQLLLNAGADHKAKDVNDGTQLMIAAQRGNAECLQLLLNAGANKEATNAKNSTALLFAATHGHLECIKCLLKAGCDVNTLTTDGVSDLFLAVFSNHVDCVRALVEAGADITIVAMGKSIVDVVNDTNDSDELRTALLVSEKKRRCCGQCGATTFGQEMIKCGACVTTYYCNRDCQLANWPIHKLACNAE
jgi:ankyrin repeat protein